MRSSQKAFELIVSEEDGSQSFYVAHYQHFDFPGGVSGPTVGIGYDMGYSTPAEAAADWTGIVSADTVAHLVSACGLKGSEAHAFVATSGRSVTITWDEAMLEFREREMPKQESELDAALPNTDALSGDSYGALASLSYNRGPSFSAVGPRYAEMRAIKAHMAAKAFDLIPGELLSMRRLWPTGGDLWRRRGHEADLFRAGLGQAPVSGLAPRPAPQKPPDRSTRTLQSDLNHVLDLRPALAVDGVFGAGTESAVEKFQRLAKLGVDGRAGIKTWGALEAWMTNDPVP